MKVFITGSTRGFGLELAKAFSRAGYDIVLNGRSNLIFTTDWGFCKASAKELSVASFMYYGPDIIINNGFDKADCIGSLDAQMNVLREAIKYFERVGGGKIINVNSSAGLIADVKAPEYAAAKWGLRGYSESLKFGAYTKGVNIMDLHPGAINVGMSDYREDLDKIIDARELCDFIVTMCATKRFIISTIHFNRMGVKA